MSKETIYFDGACLPKNPGGIACFGVIAVGSNNVRIKEKWGIVSEHGTNNIAEWNGLIEALKLARELGWKDVKILGDSQLVVNQFTDLWRIKKRHLRCFFDNALKEAKKLKNVKVSWIPRKQNLADPVCHKAFIDHVEEQARQRALKEIDKYTLEQIDNNSYKIIKKDKRGNKIYKVVLGDSFSCICPAFKKYNSYPLVKRSNLILKCKHFFIIEKLKGGVAYE